MAEALMPHEVNALAEVLSHGDQREAARCLGVSYQYLKQTLFYARQKQGAVSTFDLPVKLGWVTFPVSLHQNECETPMVETALESPEPYEVTALVDWLDHVRVGQTS